LYNTIYPNYVKSYYGYNNQKQIAANQDAEKQSKSSQNAENSLQQSQSQTSQPKEGSYFPNGEKVAVDYYSRKKIGIDQILSDFKNTTNAIGAPDNIKAEVASYLELIQSQASKQNPNAQIIQSNLKNASQILDDYITNTLKKPSKVVENWVDALFLQQIDFKSAKVEEQKQIETQPATEEQIVEEEIPTEKTAEEKTEVQNSDIYVPQDPQLRRMFIQAKKYAAIDNKEKALYSFQNTMDYADEIGDSQACAMIHFEEGKLYDDFNQLEDALFNYDRAAKQSNDKNIKAKAHHSMAKIYDDYVYFEPAVEHYSAAVAFAGETDNLKLQTQALSDLALIHSERYDRKNAGMFMDLANEVADATYDDKVKGIIYSRSAKICEKMGDKAKALNMYGYSAMAYSDMEDKENVAKNYMSAAEIMKQYGNNAKAKKLMSKAYIAAQQTDNKDLKMQITQAITSI
jgi:tetratricopeptide (TPR) repeat protein